MAGHLTDNKVDQPALTLVYLLGDQLSVGVSSLRAVDPERTVILMTEVADETGYVRHHKKKIALIFSAMRHFAEELRALGWTVDYVKLDDEGNSGSFDRELQRAVTRHRPGRILVTEAGEWRVQQILERWPGIYDVLVRILPDDRFLCGRLEFQTWAQRRPDLVMEFFYRDMRRRYGILMTADGEPEGGRWNFDAENRETPPRGLNYPAPPFFEPDEISLDVLALVGARFGDHFGDLEPFGMPVTRVQALEALDHFIHTRLPDFGRYQDAMIAGQDHLYHSVLSYALNLGLLLPGEVCAAAEDAYRVGAAPLNSVEGFIRQILGWREYVRGYYFLEMPEVGQANALGATRPLPDFYWTGETDMRCMAEAVRATREHAYAHHIQRLMILGNFALLAGVRPNEISDWFSTLR